MFSSSYYYSKAQEHLEIDLILKGEEGILLLEEKSVNGKMAASRAVMEGRTAYHASKCYKVIKENFGKGSFYTSIPQYAVPFVLDKIRNEMEEGYAFAKLLYLKKSNDRIMIE